MNKVVKGIAKVGIFVGSIAGITYYSKKNIKRSSELEGRYKAYYQLANQWLMNKNENKSVAKYFTDNDIKSIAIYGMGTLGELLYNEIKSTDIKVKYFIDKNADELYYGLDDINVTGLSDISTQEEVDAVIVTPVFDFDSIQEEIESKGCELNLISLEDVIYNA